MISYNMKHVSKRELFVLISRRYHSNTHLSRRQEYEEERRSVRVWVWWDFEKCDLPQESNVFKVAHNISNAVRGCGIKGPVSVTAFGDVLQLSRTNQEAMTATGITLTHIPNNNGKNSADRSLLVDLMCWVSQNPPPAHLFLISGDRDFATILHRLRMSNYNILLAGPESAPGVICSAASIFWQWNALAKGENVNGKYFNQPPDGPYGSWYGHYKAPLEDPFAVIEQSSCPRPEEFPDPNQDLKPQPVPKTIMKKLRQILCSHPKGISITDLRSELGKSNIDKDFYGFKKFSRFLLSMPHILKLQSGHDGQLFVHNANLRWPELAEPTNGVTNEPVATKEDPESVPTKMVNSKGVITKPSLQRGVEQNVKPYENIEKPLSTSTIEASIKPNVKVEKPSLPSGIDTSAALNEIIEKVDKAEMNKQPTQSVEISNPTPEVGFFGRTWREWLYGMDGGTEISTSSAETTTHNVKVDQSNLNSTSQLVDAVKQSTNNGKEIIPGVDAEDSKKDRRDLGIFKRVAARCMFWRNRTTIGNSNAYSGEKLEPATVDLEKLKLFRLESFWKELEAFLCTPPNGSVLVLHSMSREQMAHKLQKHGPLVLRSFSHSDLLQLVDLLITEKKWVEECHSQAYPFKLVLPSKDNSSNTPNKGALRSAFLSLSLPSVSETSQKTCVQRRNHDLPGTGVSPPVTNNKTPGFNKSRNDILSDCQKLVDDIVKESPSGFNMGGFWKRFLDTYGYPLDTQKLGYQKLVTLLQIMPGVKVESSYLYPSCNVSSGIEIFPLVEDYSHNRVLPKSESESSDPSSKDDETDATWDELGPVAVTGSKQNEEGGFQKKTKDVKEKWVNRDYEALADDYITDTDEDTLPTTGSGLPEKSKSTQEDSSLISLLNTFYSTKEDTKERLESEAANCSENESKSLGSYGGGGCGLVLKTEDPFARCGLKPKSARTFTFVSEQSENRKDKLIDGILGSMKKSGESRVHG